MCSRRWEESIDTKISYAKVLWKITTINYQRVLYLVISNLELQLSETVTSIPLVLQQRLIYLYLKYLTILSSDWFLVWQPIISVICWLLVDICYPFARVPKVQRMLESLRVNLISITLVFLSLASPVTEDTLLNIWSNCLSSDLFIW